MQWWLLEYAVSLKPDHQTYQQKPFLYSTGPCTARLRESSGRSQISSPGMLQRPGQLALGRFSQHKSQLLFLPGEPAQIVVALSAHTLPVPETSAALCLEARARTHWLTGKLTQGLSDGRAC